MKKLIITLLLVFGLSLNLFTQTKTPILKYKCIHFFKGTIYNEDILWDPTQEITKKNIIKIKKNHITIENGKWYFDVKEQFSENITNKYIEYRWYAIDKNKQKCIIILMTFEDYTHIYFEYEDIMFGYNIVLIKVK